MNYYDILSGSGVSWYFVQQLASIVHVNESELVINTKKVQKQNNCVDCGLFALAFATSLLNARNPEEQTHSVTDLRPHLLQCIQGEHMKEFPNETTAKCQRVRTTTVKLTLYCHCRMPWRPADKKLSGMKMAECEICWKMVPPKLRRHSRHRFQRCCLLDL